MSEILSTWSSRGARRARFGLCALSLAAILIPAAAHAQLRVMPTVFRPVHDPFPTYSVQVTYAKGFAGVSNLDALGGWVSLEGERLRCAAGVALLMPDGGGNKVALAATVGYRISGLLTLFPVVSQVGLGFSQLDVAGGHFEQLDIPLGAAVGLAGLLPLQHISNVEPWVGWSVVIRRSHLSTTVTNESAVRGGVALSLGVNVGLPVGIGGHLEAQFARMRSPFAPEWSGENSLGLGVFFRY